MSLPRPGSIPNFSSKEELWREQANSRPEDSKQDNSKVPVQDGVHRLGTVTRSDCTKSMDSILNIQAPGSRSDSLLEQGAWMAKLDLSDAYFPGEGKTPRHLDRKLLRFLVEGQLYEFQVLPSALKS